MTQSTDAFDRDVRRFVYDVVLRRGYPPTTAEAAAGLRATVDEVRACFARLAAGHILVLQSGAGEILMANPFSAVPTPFLVEFDDYACYGNCIWTRWESSPCVVGMRSSRHRAETAGRSWKCGLSPEPCSPARALRTTRFPPAGGGMTSSSPERPCCFSGRKST